MYKCEACSWEGSRLRYVGHDRLPRERELLTLPDIVAGQGVCPRCGIFFHGCVHPSRLPGYTPKLNEHEREILRDLAHASRQAEDYAARGYATSVWQRPLDVGGHNGSHHSATLAGLTEKGLVMRRQRSALSGRRGSWEYRLTPEGHALLDQES